LNKIILLLILTVTCTAEYTRKDSLLEAATYLYQIKGNPEKAAQLFEKIIAGYPDDPYAVEMAKKGLRFCLSATGKQSRLKEILIPGKPKQDTGAFLLMWRQNYGSGNITGIAEAGNDISVTTGDGFLILASRKNGKVLWVLRGINSRMPPVFFDKRVYAVGKNSMILSSPLKERKVQWLSSAPGITSGLCVSRSRIIYTASGSNGVAVNVKTNTLLWKRGFKTRAWISQTPVLCGSNVIYQVPGRGISVLNGKNGQVIWKSSIKPDLPPIVTPQAVILVAGATIYALSKKDGKMIWNLSGELAITYAGMARETDLIIMDNAGEIKGIDLNSGKTKLAFMARKGKCIVHDSRIYLADSRGQVNCYTRDGKMVWHYPTGEIERSDIQMVFGHPAVLTENSGLFILNGKYHLKEDPRLVKARAEIDILVKSGRFRTARERISHYLKNIAPGDPMLNMYHAQLVQEKGDTEKACIAWERYISLADPAEINDRRLLGKLRRLSNAGWVTYIESAGKFNPFYAAGPRIVMLCQGEINVLDAHQGTRKWRYRMRSPNTVMQTATVFNENIYCYGEKKLICLNLDDQKALWTTRIKGNVTRMASDNRSVLLGTWNRGCLLVDRHTGQIKQKFLQSIKALFPFIEHGNIYCIGLEGIIAGFSSGKYLFKQYIGDKISSIPCIHDEKIIVSTAMGYIKVFSTENGAKLWEKRTGVQSASMSYDKSMLFTVFSNAMAAAFDLETGQKRWLKKSAYGTAENIEFSNGLLAMAGGNHIEICRAETGEKIRTLKTVGRVSSIIFEQGVLFARLENGLVYRFDIE
jgi:outer membrane protein assembly factor BamB